MRSTSLASTDPGPYSVARVNVARGASSDFEYRFAVFSADITRDGKAIGHITRSRSGRIRIRGMAHEDRDAVDAFLSEHWTSPRDAELGWFRRAYDDGETETVAYTPELAFEQLVFEHDRANALNAAVARGDLPTMWRKQAPSTSGVVNVWWSDRGWARSPRRLERILRHDDRHRDGGAVFDPDTQSWIPVRHRNALDFVRRAFLR